MIGSRAWFALMRRNFLYRKRHWLSTLLEMALPVAFLGILIAIKNSLGDDTEAEIVEPTFPTPEEVYRPISFLDYVTTFTAARICVPPLTQDFEEYTGDVPFDITGMPVSGYDWQNPFVRCDNLKCEAVGQDAQPFCEYGFLGVTGSGDGANGRAQAFRDYIYETYPSLSDREAMPFDFDFVQSFQSEDEMEAYVTSKDYGTPGMPKMTMGVVWQGNATNAYKYTLRQNSTGYNVPWQPSRPGALTTPDTSIVFDAFAPNDDSCPIFDGAAYMGPRQSSCTGQYLYNGIITIQKLVGDFILKDSGVDTRVADHGIRLVPFPTKEYQQGGFFEQIAVFVPLLLTLGLLFPVSQMISYVCREKELRQKELLKMMSVAESDIGWSWFVSYLLVNLVVATICAITATYLYTNSSVFIMWIFWVLSFLALVVFSLFIAAMSAKTTRTVLIGLLLVFMGVFLTLAVDYEDGNAGTIQILSLHPITAFSYGLLELGRLEDIGLGVTKDSIQESDSPSGYTFADALQSLVVDTILWGIVGWYLNRVITPDFGQALPWYFPFTASYWKCGGNASPSPPVKEEALNITDEQANGDLVPIEGVSDALRSQTDSNIIMRQLGKKFGDKTAVENLNLTMYNGQVTALLGHNGAGKTTTISMLTGSLAATSGTAKILGRNLQSELSTIRDDLGICLQHDCLFPSMTVREHIQFFSRLKGLYHQMPYKEAEAHVDQIIKDVALFEKRHSFSKNLSGGMKRKLSVAMAFCGGSKVVLLDEPTSGMDPFSRRFTWNIIRQFRQNRCILLTTHFMDEADVLGDRIAIMADGQLRCVGSPLFLKKHYGVGYQLTIEKAHDTVGQASSEELEELNSKLVHIVQNNVKNAALLNNVGSELSFQLPVGEAANFGPMFQGLDENVDNGVISSYGVGITTMEEVFLLVARGDEVGESKAHLKSSGALPVAAFLGDDDASTEKSTRSRMNLEQDNLFFTHVRALWAKRAANFRRDKRAWCCTTILPGVFVLFGLLVFAFASPDRALGPLELQLSDYNPNVQSAPRNPITVNYVDQVFQCQPGVCGYSGGNIPFSYPQYNDNYVLCGIQSLVNPPINFSSLLEPGFKIDDLSSGGWQSCSITASSSFMDTITEEGVQIVEAEMNTIDNSSQVLFANIDAYAASQYAAIIYTHDAWSVLGDGSLFAETVFQNCTSAFRLAESFGQSLLNKESDCPAYIGLGYTIQYNFTAYHVVPTYMALATEGIARTALGTDNFTVETTIHPLPLTFFEEGVVETEDAFTAWFLLVLSFPFIAGSFGTFIVSERESKAKHLQTVTGVKPWGYWVSTYLWDVVNYQLPLWIVVAMFFIFGVSAFTTTDYGVVGGVICAMVLFGPAAAGFTYCLSYLFKSPALCNVVVIISGFLIGMGGPITVIVLIIIGSDPSDPNPKLIDVGDIVSWVLRFHPCFCLGRAIYFSLNVEYLVYIYPDVTSVWAPEILLYDVIFLAWESVVYLLLAIQIDIWSTNPSIVSSWKKFTNCLTCSSPRSPDRDITTELEEDSDVLEEEDRVAKGGANNDIIVIDKLTKIYDNGKKAVNGLSLGIPPGQVFGLLGVNGAGKTTTMQMLTAEFPATSGDATLAGYSVSKEPEKTRRRVGYCPQFDAHFANMTGREHVELYATIKGIPSDAVKDAAASKLQEVGLSEVDGDRLAANYSGGMKRRLSLACATIGEPQIVFLDECSTGVDPVARREIWELISNMVAGRNVAPEERTSVILTTHSMEECEALCPRIGIMSNGRLRALGSAQHLKNKFGKGYQIELKCKLVTNDDPDFVDVYSKLSGTRLEGNSGAGEEIFFNLEQTIAALQELTGDTYLSSVINDANPVGYNVHKSATSPPGITLEELAAFAAVELRLRKIAEYIVSKYATNIFRERQDTKLRYEVGSEGLKISEIFSSLEENKERLLLDDYGVSQTSLEQVFNMHAAAAEHLKGGTDDH